VSGPGVTTRLLEPHEHRTALDLFRDGHHQPPATDADWLVLRDSLEPSGVRGAFRGSHLIGMHQTVVGDVVVSGGARVPVAVQHRLAVRNGHTRQGVARSLMVAALRSAPAPLAMVRPSEGGIYGHFDFTVGTRCRDLVVDRHRARLTSHVPTGGHAHVSSLQDVAPLLPQLYEETRSRAGTVSRPAWYEPLYAHDVASAGLFCRVIVHEGPEGDTGFARYVVRRVSTQGGGARTVLEVDDMHYGSPRAWAGLWRALLGMDLVDEVRVRRRPLDEPAEWLFVDPRTCRTTAVHDETWLRLTDVDAAFRARRFSGDGGIVIGVEDALLPDNSGHYRVSGEGISGTRTAAQLSGPVSAWSAAYLGTVTPSALAAVGALRVHDTRALEVADRLFSVCSEPWSGTFL
jgi:predicted acetyltransferase